MIKISVKGALDILTLFFAFLTAQTLDCLAIFARTFAGCLFYLLCMFKNWRERIKNLIFNNLYRFICNELFYTNYEYLPLKDFDGEKNITEEVLKRTLILLFFRKRFVLIHIMQNFKSEAKEIIERYKRRAKKDKANFL